MIRVEMDMARPALRIEGHAGYAHPGRDIVCAAASMLAYTLLFRVRTIARPGELTEESIEKGRMHIVIRPGPGRRQAFQPAFETVREGFALLARQYPDHISLAEIP